MLCAFNFRFIKSRFNLLLEIKTSLLSAEKDMLLSISDQLLIDMLSKNSDLTIENVINICVNRCNNLIEYYFI